VTVAELIAELERLDPALPVLRADSEDSDEPVSEVEVIEELVWQDISKSRVRVNRVRLS